MTQGLSDWRNIADEREKYAAYLCSREWCEKRETVQQRSEGKCERCLRNPADHVHHLTYARKYAELLDDLQAVCKPCHDFIHGKSSDDPAGKFVTPNLCEDAYMVHLCCPGCGTLGVAKGGFWLEDNSETVKVNLECPNGHKWYMQLMLFPGSRQIALHYVSGWAGERDIELAELEEVVRKERIRQGIVTE